MDPAFHDICRKFRGRSFQNPANGFYNRFARVFNSLIRLFGRKLHSSCGCVQLIAVSPIRNGQVADFDIAELMFKYFIRKAIGVSYLGKPRIIVSVPCSIDDVNRKALTEAIRMAGSKHVFLIEKPFASAIGTGLPVYDPIGNLVVDIGAGTTDVAVISLGGLVVSQSVQVGGNKFNEAIAEYLRRECSILVGE